MKRRNQRHSRSSGAPTKPAQRLRKSPTLPRFCGIRSNVATAKHPPIGPRLRALRLQLRWSQNDLSERSGLRRIEISALESGRNIGSSWRVRTLLAKGFGIKKPELDAYWAGTNSPNEIAANVRPRGPERALVASPAPVDPAGKVPAHFFATFPNLRDAVRILVKDSGAEDQLVKDAAYRVAANATEDKKIMEWAVLVKDALDRLISATRINPLKVPHLAAAIRLLAQETPLLEPKLKELAARLVAEHRDALAPTTIEWVRELDRALARDADGESSQRSPGAVRKRSPAKR